MIRIKDWFQQKIARREKKFLAKLQKSAKFSATEKQKIIKHLQEGQIKEIVHVFFVFLVLSGIFSIGDLISLLLNLGVNVVQDSHSYWFFAGFLIASGLFKIWYAHISLLKFSWFDKILSTLPYFGASLLLAKGLKDTPLTRKALWLYLKNQL